MPHGDALVKMLSRRCFHGKSSRDTYEITNLDQFRMYQNIAKRFAQAPSGNRNTTQHTSLKIEPVRGNKKEDVFIVHAHRKKI